MNKSIIFTIFLIICGEAEAMDSIGSVGAYAIDRGYCNIAVSQEWIEYGISSAAREYGITRQDAFDRAVIAGAALEQYLLETGRMNEWCRLRRGR